MIKFLESLSVKGKEECSGHRGRVMRVGRVFVGAEGVRVVTFGQEVGDAEVRYGGGERRSGPSSTGLILLSGGGERPCKNKGSTRV